VRLALPIFPRTRRNNCLLNVLILVLLASSVLSADQRLSNWAGHFEPCNRSSELLKHNYMDVGVWLNTSNVALAAEFRHAMNFWTEVLDMNWHEENTLDCSIQVVDGSPALFAGEKVIAARSQLTTRANFYGWIAFNPGCRLTRAEMYLTAIHEIGHMLGLQHNPSAESVMYFLNLEGKETLDDTDLAFLATRHRLRNNPARETLGSVGAGVFRATPSSTRPEAPESPSVVSSDSMTH
jgi:Matrixin